MKLILASILVLDALVVSGCGANGNTQYYTRNECERAHRSPCRVEWTPLWVPVKYYR